MAKDITPDKQSVEACLKQKKYYVDFYQREYVWRKETVEVLLRDIFYLFDISYELHKDEELTEAALEGYNWYYLNVFITNNIDGKVYIVDGQQRLTTLTLIATKLYHMTSNENLKDTLRECIYAKDKFKGNIFCIDHEKRMNVMQSILEKKEYTVPYKNKTEQTLIERYADISQFLDDKEMDTHRLETFICYFLERLVLVELSIQKEDTPMVFEVINDRGEALRPFEIIKGKMLGLLSKVDTDVYSAKWDESMSALTDLQDEFFTDWIKSQFLFKSNAKLEASINNLYHRYLFDNNDIAAKLGFRKTDKGHVASIKKFVNETMAYYSRLYAKIRRNEDVFLKYDNEINMFKGQYQNILAACSINDPEEDDKIRTIAKEVDRMWVLLVLNGAYDSNEYQNITYGLNELLHNADIKEYRSIFNKIIEQTIRQKRNLSSAEVAISLLDYSVFMRKDYTNCSPRFLRYFFSRIEEYICSHTNQSMMNDVMYVSTRTGNKSGYHIEHILSNNQESISMFETEEEFNTRRNQLGGLLLLKGLDNISSGNEAYADKLKTYSHGFVLGHTLCPDFYNANKDFETFNNSFKNSTGVEFRSYDTFDVAALDERCLLVWNLAKVIWEV